MFEHGLRIGVGLALVAVGAVASVGAPAQAAGGLSDETRAAIDRIMGRVKADGPGLSLAVIEEGRVAYQGSRGLANVAAGTRLTSQTVFDLASCSKQFTAMAVMIASEKGLLSFKDNIRRFVPEIPLHDASRPITIDHLLHMTSGLPIYTEFMDDLEGVRNVDIARAVGKRKLAFSTGSKHVYSNTDYALLALIVERAAKKPFAAFVRETIFQPAGMKQSMVLDDPAWTVPGRAQGYTPKEGKRGFDASRDDTHVVGDGQVFSTLEDMIRWDRALRASTLVKPKLGKQAFLGGRLNDGDECEYGLGWFVAKDDGVHFVSHEGNWTGTNTYISRDLVADVSVIVLSNNDAIDASGLGTKIEETYE